MTDENHAAQPGPEELVADIVKLCNLAKLIELAVQGGAAHAVNSIEFTRLQMDVESRIRDLYAAKAVPASDRYQQIISSTIVECAKAIDEAAASDEIFVSTAKYAISKVTQESVLSNIAAPAQPVAAQPAKVLALLDEIAGFQEINQFNYSNDDVVELNNWGVAVWDLAEEVQKTLAAPPAQPESKEAQLREWLRERFVGYDFKWGDPAMSVAVFEVGSDFRGGRDIVAAIDGEIAASKSKGGCMSTTPETLIDAIKRIAAYPKTRGDELSAEAMRALARSALAAANASPTEQAAHGQQAAKIQEYKRGHVLKVWPEYFDALQSGEKTFELRKDDRGFRVGEWLHLREWDPRREIYSGRELYRKITYIISGKFGLENDFVCMAIESQHVPTEQAKKQIPYFVEPCPTCTTVRICQYNGCKHEATEQAAPVLDATGERIVRNAIMWAARCADGRVDVTANPWVADGWKEAGAVTEYSPEKIEGIVRVALSQTTAEDEQKELQALEREVAEDEPFAWARKGLKRGDNVMHNISLDPVESDNWMELYTRPQTQDMSTQSTHAGNVSTNRAKMNMSRQPQELPAMSDEEILAKFEKEISAHPAGYLKPFQTVYQVTKPELIAFARNLLSRKPADGGKP